MIDVDASLREARIRNKLSELFLEQKIGQMLVAGFPGPILAPEVAAMVGQCHLGGVMLSQGNIANPGQVAILTAGLQQLSVSETGLPMFVAVDQEGGTVNRLRASATVMPSAMALAATRDARHAVACALATARDMRTVGINTNFAPVLDVNSEPSNPVIGIRSFGDSPSLVAEMGVAVIRALGSGGIVTTAKHFPGHGGANVDSHLGLPVILRSRDLLNEVDLHPFREAIANGVDMVMTAHAVFPALASDHLPATVSPEIITGVLRREMGFAGIVITDAIVMRAIAERYSLAEAAIAAIQSGSDIVLTLGRLDENVEVFEGLLRAVKAGQIPVDAVDASVARILAAKARLTSFALSEAPNGTNAASWPLEAPPPVIPVLPERTGIQAHGMDFASWSLEEHRRLARDVARRSITLVKNGGGLLPLCLRNGERLGLVEFTRACLSPVEDDACDDGSMVKLLSKRHSAVSYLAIDVAPQDGKPALAKFAEECDVMVVVTRDAHIIYEQAALVRKTLELGKPTVVLAVRNPYDLISFPSATCYVASYGDSPVALEAAVDLLFGEYEPSGKLPISLPGLFPFGHGLEGF
ncbi:MAG: glycoside hydrolase family 3 C-terminal domain-containing protein [Chloroflexi bacterium]|nr:glycoside hydrolase family 3 C-terminal domain-containing protein [Chloroflexota bacterium]